MFARLAGALKRKKDATKFEVTLRIHSLSPWPGTAKFKRLAIKWQRGDKRSGTTKPVLGADDPTARAPGKGFHLKFAFNDTVTFPVTLYKESETSSSYAKKTLTLTVLESADVSGRNPTEVGTLVLNLADFASTDAKTDELRKVIKASGAITTVVGDPFLAFSISVTWNKNAGPGGAASSVASDSAEDDDDDDDKSKPAVPPPAAARPTLAGRARPPPPPFAEDADAEVFKKKPGASSKKPAADTEESEEEEDSNSDSDSKPSKAPAAKTVTIPAKKPAPAAALPPAAAAAASKKAAVPGLPKKQVYDSDGFLVDEDEDDDDDVAPPAAKEPPAKGKAGKGVEHSFESSKRSELLGKAPPAVKAGANGGAAGEPEDPNRAALFSSDTSMLFQKKKAPGPAGAPGAPGGAKLALGRTGSGTLLGGPAAKKPAAAPAAPAGKSAVPEDDSEEESPPAKASAANGKSSGSAAWDDGSIASSDEDAPKPVALKPGVSARSAAPKGALKKKAGGDQGSDEAPPAKPPAAKKGSAAAAGGGVTKRVAFAPQSSDGEEEEEEEEPEAPKFSSSMFTKKAAPQPAAKPSRGSDESEEEEEEPDTPVTSEDEESPPPRKPAVVIPARSGSGAAKAAEEERKRKEAEAAAAAAEAAAKAEAERKRLEEEARAEAARVEAEAAAEAKAKAERKAAKKAKAAKEAEAAAAPAEPAAKPAVSGSARTTSGSARTGNGAVAPAAVEASVPAAAVAAVSAGDGSAMRGELVDCAALDLALRTGPASPCGARGPVHGPARGCVHALRCATPGVGVAALCHRMAGAFATSLLSCGGAGQALFWWSNIAALRTAVSLRAVWEPADAPPQALLTWLQGTCVRLEGAACLRAASAAWDTAVAPACRRAPAPPARGHSVDDALAGHWVAALDGAEGALMAGATDASQLGTFPGLTSTALSHVLARLDAALFNALLRPGDSALVDAITVKAAIPGGGGVTFSSGVAIKLTVERLSGWASARKVVSAAGSGSAAHFPLLKAAADVLMMPKGALLDTTVRADVSGSLSPVLLRALLARFTPDEASPEAVPPVLLTALDTQAKQQMSKEQRKAAKTPAAVATPPPYSAPEAAALGVDWLDWDGFPLNEDGLAAVKDPLRALLGGDATQPPPGAPPAMDVRFTALRESWGV